MIINKKINLEKYQNNNRFCAYKKVFYKNCVFKAISTDTKIV